MRNLLNTLKSDYEEENESNVKIWYLHILTYWYSCFWDVTKLFFNNLSVFFSTHKEALESNSKNLKILTIEIRLHYYIFMSVSNCLKIMYKIRGGPRTRIRAGQNSKSADIPRRGPRRMYVGL